MIRERVDVLDVIGCHLLIKPELAGAARYLRAPRPFFLSFAYPPHEFASFAAESMLKSLLHATDG